MSDLLNDFLSIASEASKKSKDEKPQLTPDQRKKAFIEWLETQIKRYRLVGEPEPNWNTIYDKAKEML